MPKRHTGGYRQQSRFPIEIFRSYGEGGREGGRKREREDERAGKRKWGVGLRATRFVGSYTKCLVCTDSDWHSSVLQCVAVCCSVLQCVAVCCSVLQCVAVCCGPFCTDSDWPSNLTYEHEFCHTYE